MHSAYAGSGTQYLVKWKGLGYDDCTWESSHDLLPRFKPEIAKFQSQHPIANELLERQKSHSQVCIRLLADLLTSLPTRLVTVRVCLSCWVHEVKQISSHKQRYQPAEQHVVTRYVILAIPIRVSLLCSL